MKRTPKLTIYAKLPSLNEYINLCRSSKYQAAEFKNDVEEIIGWYIIKDKSDGKLDNIKLPCDIMIEYHEKTRKRDVDNIQSSQKFIIDSLVKNGIIPNDGQKYIKNIYHTIQHDNIDFAEIKFYSAGSLKVIETGE